MLSLEEPGPYITCVSAGIPVKIQIPKDNSRFQMIQNLWEVGPRAPCELIIKKI